MFTREEMLGWLSAPDAFDAILIGLRTDARLQDRYFTVAQEQGYHPDDDFEPIIERMIVEFMQEVR